MSTKPLPPTDEPRYTVDDMAATLNIELPPKAFKVLTESLIFLSRYQNEPVTVGRRRSNVNGKCQSYKVAQFSAKYLDTFDQMCRIMEIT